MEKPIRRNSDKDSKKDPIRKNSKEGLGEEEVS